MSEADTTRSPKSNEHTFWHQVIVWRGASLFVAAEFAQFAEGVLARSLRFCLRFSQVSRRDFRVSEAPLCLRAQEIQMVPIAQERMEVTSNEQESQRFITLEEAAVDRGKKGKLVFAFGGPIDCSRRDLTDDCRGRA